MPELSGAPWRALAKVVRDGGTGTRTWAVGVGITDETASGDQSSWTGAPGTSLTLTYQTGTSGLTPPGAANTVTIEIRTPDGAQIGTTDWTNPTDGETRTFHFDADPLDEAAGTNRWGCFEIYIRAVRTDLGSYDLDSRGTGAGGSDDWAQGYLRAPVTLSSESLSDASLGGAEPAEFWYPDSIFFRANLSDTCVEAHDLDFDIAAIRNAVDNGSDTQRDYSLTAANETVDADFTAGTEDITLTLPSTTFGGDAKFVWAASGHDADWTRTSDAVLTDAGRFAVDPTVTFANLALDGASTDVFNRGETCGGSIEIHNAGGEKFTPQGSDQLDIIRVADASVEETVDTVVRDGSDVLQWDVTFDTSGNTAPADSTGDGKALRWSDTSGANSPTADSTQVGLLSSLYDVDIHLQNNDNALDPSLSTTQRLISDLGFYSVKISNQRSQGVDGVSVTDRLRDDADLVSEISRTDTTATTNGNAGYLPLKAWDSQLPGGGWDHWTDSGSHNGNTFEKARSGAGTADYTLLAIDPNLSVIPGAGPKATADDGDHWHPGEDLLVGIAVYNGATKTTEAVDVDGGGNPRAYVVIGRFNTTLGRAEYLEADHQTWTAINGGTAIEHQLAESAGDSQTYVLTIDAADTGTWNEADLFIIGIAYVNSTPYSLQNMIDSLSNAANAHDGYALDALDLALNGSLSQR